MQCSSASINLGAPNISFPCTSSLHQDLKTISVRDQAALLLSVAAIAKSEITSNPSSLDLSGSFPLFPRLADDANEHYLTPRTDLEVTYAANVNFTPSPASDMPRIRAVSIDSPIPMKLLKGDSFLSNLTRSISPTETPVQNLITPISSPVSYVRHPIRKHRLRISLKGRHENFTGKRSVASTADVVANVDDTVGTTFELSHTNKKLQGDPPKGTRIKKIMRRKFSWKNFPEVRSITRLVLVAGLHN